MPFKHGTMGKKLRQSVLTQQMESIMPGATRVGSRLRFDNPNRDTTNEDRRSFLYGIGDSLRTFVANNPSIAKGDLLPTVACLCLPIAIREQKEHDEMRASPDRPSLESYGHSDEVVAEILAERVVHDTHTSKNSRLANSNFKKVIDLQSNGLTVDELYAAQFKLWQSGLRNLFNLSFCNDFAVRHILENHKV